MTHQTSKIAIDFLFNYINNLPPSINLKEFTNKKSDVSLSRQAILTHYFYLEFPDQHNIEDTHRKIKKMTKETVFKIGYIYLVLLRLLQYENNDDHYHYHEQWFIRQVMAAMQNFNNPDFKSIDLNEIYNIEWD